MRKSRLLEEAIKTNRLLSEQYEALQKIYTENAMLFHDMNNHLQTIYHMAEESNPEGIRDYISRVSSPVRDMAGVLWSNVGIVDAILNDKKKAAEQKGYSFHINAELPANTGIAAEDFCTILSNLLDNAIESLDRQQNAAGRSEKIPFRDSSLCYIDVSLRRINHFLMIQVSNPCQEKPITRKGLFSSLKSDSFHHGWGLKNIKKAAAKYNGNFSCEIIDGCFVATVMLFFSL